MAGCFTMFPKTWTGIQPCAVLGLCSHHAVGETTDRDETTLKVSEIFASIQGEGPSAGEPAAFLRLAGCNLHCQWCDTKYTWDWQNYDYAREVTITQVAAVRDRLLALDPRRLVITGGEPLLQQDALGQLLGSLTEEWIVEVETNGTVAPQTALMQRVNQWNVSPKLSHAQDPLEQRVKPAVLQAFANNPRAWLKLVVQQSIDHAEILEIVSNCGWPHERVLLMPEAQSAEMLALRSPLVAQLAHEAGFAVSPRLHVALWNGRRGV